MAKSPKEVVREWAEAFDSCDAEAVAECYHDDAVNLQVAIGTPLVGKAAILADLQAFFSHNPDSRTKIETLFEDGEWAIIEWSGGATFYSTPRSRGKQYSLRGCGFFHVVDGKIKTQRGYWDKATWSKQIDLAVS